MSFLIGSPFYSWSFKHGIEKYNEQFVVYAGLILLLGKKFKTSEFLSGRMADIMGSMYICTALGWYVHQHDQGDNTILNSMVVIAQKEELIKIRQNFQDIANNFPLRPIRVLMQFLNRDLFSWDISDNERKLLAESISKHVKSRQLFLENIHLPPLLEIMCKEHQHVLEYHSKINGSFDKTMEELIHKAISVNEYSSKS
jgi:hypothetical protein